MASSETRVEVQVMVPRAKVAGVVVAVALLIAGAIVLLVARRAPDVDPESARKAPGADADALSSAESLPPAAPPSAGSPQMEAIPFAAGEKRDEEASPAQPRLATIRGRCVDAATGAPLAGCSVRFRGWAGNSERQDAHVAKHGPVAWNDPPETTTAADGAFAFRFDPPPPWQFMLDCRVPDRVPMSGRWSNWEPGRELDLGDVPLQPGTAVTGRVLDDSGAPVAKARVSLTRTDRARPGSDAMRPREPGSERSGADGRFAFRDRFLPGTWTVQVDEEPGDPPSIEIAAGEEARPVEIRVPRRESGAQITGIVVDDRGEPVARAEIELEPRPMRGTTVTSGTDGTFRVSQQGETKEVRLRARREGYQESEQVGPVAWGTEGVRLVMKRGLGIAIAVTDARTNAPVEHYGVRCFGDPKHGGRRNSADQRLRELGRHPGGVLELRGVTSGPKVLVVEVREATGLAQAVRRFEVTESGAPRQDIALEPMIGATIALRRADGTPVPKSVVEVLRNWGDAPIGLDARPWSFGTSMLIDAPQPQLLASGETDERGCCRVSVPAREALAVRALGPGHVPLIRETVSFDPAAPELEIVVTAGATVVGRIVPEAYVRQVLLTRAAAPRRSLSADPSLSLRDGNRKQVHPAGSVRLPLADDGTFRMEGAPSGDWELMLHVTEWTQDGRSGSGTSMPIARLESLKDGETRTLELDMSSLMKATLDGEVTVGGEILAGASVSLHGRSEVPGGGTMLRVVQHLVTDERGRFQAKLHPGEYRLALYSSAGNPPRQYVDAQVFRVSTGQTLSKRFDIRTCTLALECVLSDGTTPAEGVEVIIDFGQETLMSVTPATDERGLTSAPLLPAGATIELEVWPRELLSREARAAFFQDGKRSWTEVIVKVATVTLAAPETKLRVVLPASARY